MRLLKNFKKALSQNRASQSGKHPKSFPKIIEEHIMPVDVTKDENGVKQQKPNQELSIKPISTDAVSDSVTKSVANNIPNSIPELPDEGFFVMLYKELKEGKIKEEELVSKDLVKQMQDYWHNDESIIKHQSETAQLKFSLQRNVTQTLQKLSVLEQQWKLKKIKIEQLKRELEELENEISIESYRLKELVKKLKYHEHVNPEHYFKLFDGRTIRSLTELIGALKIMGDEDFYKHVTGTRNDFADWIEHSLKEPELASKVHGVTNRQQLIELLEQSIKHNNVNA